MQHERKLPRFFFLKKKAKLRSIFCLTFLMLKKKKKRIIIIIMMTTSAERATPNETPSFPFASQLVAHHTILTRITQLGMIISLICLSMCIFTFWFLSEIQSTRTTIHKNLCCSLFMAEFIFLVGINMNTHKVGVQMHFSPKCSNLNAPLINEAEQTRGPESRRFYRCSAS